MCVYSAVLDYGRERVHPQTWEQHPDAWPDYKELLKKAAEFDKSAGEPDCEDPAKGEWMKEMEERMKALEERTEG